MREAAIVSTARTAIGKAYRGAFNATEAPVLAGHVMNAVVERMTLASERIAAGIARGDTGIANLQKVGEPQRTRDRVAAFRERIPAIDAALA